MVISSTDYQVDSEKQDMSRGGFTLPPDNELKQGVESTEEQLEPQHIENNNLEQWNSPSINKYRYLAANFGFIIMGMNDAAYGVSRSNIESFRIRNELTVLILGTDPVSRRIL